MALAQVKLDDKYTLDEGRVLLTGAQALVRLPLVQRRRDLAAGLNTAGFISGYRGSPLAATTSSYGRHASISRTITSSSRRASTRISPPPPSGERSSRVSSAMRNMTAFSASGTARGRAWTGPATR